MPRDSFNAPGILFFRGAFPVRDDRDDPVEKQLHKKAGHIVQELGTSHVFSGKMLLILSHFPN